MRLNLPWTSPVTEKDRRDAKELMLGERNAAIGSLKSSPPGEEIIARDRRMAIEDVFVWPFASHICPIEILARLGHAPIRQIAKGRKMSVDDVLDLVQAVALVIVASVLSIAFLMMRREFLRAGQALRDVLHNQQTILEQLDRLWQRSDQHTADIEKLKAQQ